MIVLCFISESFGGNLNETQVTTKKGFRSKTQVGYTGNFDMGLAPAVDLDMMNSAEKLQYEESIINNFGNGFSFLLGRGSLLAKQREGYITKEAYEQERNRLVGTNTDWFDEIFRTSFSQSHAINLRGGSDELNYYTSLNYTKKNGILFSNSYQNAGLFLTIDYRPIKKLIFRLNVSGNSRENKDHASAIDPFNYAVFANPYEKPYNNDGSYSYDLSYLSNNYSPRTASGLLYDRFNLIKEMRENKLTQTALDAGVSFEARYEPLQGLALQTIMRRSISYNQDTREINAGTYSSWILERFARAAFPGQPVIPKQYDNGELTKATGRGDNWSVRNQIDYSFRLKDSHFFTLLAAMEATSRKFNNFGYTSPVYFSDYRITGLPVFPDAKLPYQQLYDLLKNSYVTSDGQDRSLSYIGSLQYSFRDRYVASINARADGADVIGTSNRFTPLWSVGLRYNLHNEKFFNRAVVNELSLRASLGYTGKIDRRAYPFSVIGIGDLMYHGERFVKELSFPNPTVRWERKNDKNVGINAHLFRSRIIFSADFYWNRTEDILTNLSIPISTGRRNVYANGGVVENKGMEYYLNVHWIDRNDLRFSTSFNIGKNSNKIIRSLHDYTSLQEVTKSDVLRGGPINIIGEETGSIYGWKSAGVNPHTGNPQYYLTPKGKEVYARENKVDVTQVPDVVDVSCPTGSMIIRNKWEMPSMQYLGRLNPNLVGGFGTYLKYKNIEFITDWVFKAGHMVPTFNDYQNAPRNVFTFQEEYSTDFAVSSTNRQKKYLHYWTVPGDQTSVRRFVSNPTADFWSTMYTSEKYEKGDYLRLNNLAVSYRFAQKHIEKYKLSSFSLGVNMRNLITFTRYRGIDVATGNAFNYPVAKEFNLKVSLGF